MQSTEKYKFQEIIRVEFNKKTIKTDLKPLSPFLEEIEIFLLIFIFLHLDRINNEAFDLCTYQNYVF